MTECTTSDCARPTSAYICTQCVSDLQAWVDQIPGLVADLAVSVAKLDKVTRQSGGGGGKPGSKAPLNLDALHLKSNLQTVHPDAGTYATDPNVAGIAELIIDWCQKAELVISGPVEHEPDTEKHWDRLEKETQPMPTKDLLPWLLENAKLRVTAMDIRNWARRGKLKPHTRDPQPTYHPIDVLKAIAETRR